MTAASRPVTSPACLIAVALLATAAGLAAGLLLRQVNDEAAAAPPKAESVDVGFSRDMREHHAQAVQMSLLVALTNGPSRPPWQAGWSWPRWARGREGAAPAHDSQARDHSVVGGPQ